MTTMTIAASAKLQLFRTVGQAYAMWVRNFSDLVRICWLWMLLLAPVLVMLNWWQAAYFVEATRQVSFVAPHPILTWLTALVGKAIMVPAVASVAVAWHRLLLTEEHPGPRAYLRLDRTVAGYATLACVIGMISSAPSIPIGLFQIMIGRSLLAIVFLAIPAVLVSFLILPRLSLALPGIALGRSDAELGAAWRVSKHNTWRMFWAYFLCGFLPLIAVGILTSVITALPEAILSIAIGGIGTRAHQTLSSTVTDLLWIPCSMISVGMLSLAYRHFFLAAHVSPITPRIVGAMHYDFYQ